MTVMTMAAEIGKEHDVIHVMENFGYEKVCAQWFPHLQMEEYKHQQKKNVFSKLGKRNAVKSKDFHHSIVTKGGFITLIAPLKKI